MKQNVNKQDSDNSVINSSVELSSLSILIPVYNSEETIGSLVDTVIAKLKSHFKSLEIILVNDGSIDNSHSCALQAVNRYPGIVKYIRLARNFGEHNAVMCGLNYITKDCVVIIDDDFQNPPSEIIRLVEKLREGYDVVYSYYSEKRHSWFRNVGSQFNDWVATKVLKKPKGLYLSSFKALRAVLVRRVIQSRGPYPYIDGSILRSTTKIGRLQCKHSERRAGRSHYTISKLLHLWLNMFTGFSIIPLRIASYIGFFVSLSTIILVAFFIVSRLSGGVFIKQTIPAGWASLIVSITFLAGIQLCVLGLIGEYLGRLYLTVSRLPQFVVDDTYGIETLQEQN